MYVYRNIETRSRNHCCRGRAKNITYSVCVCLSVCLSVALVIQHAVRILSSVACPNLSFFFLHYLINGTILGEKVTEHKMCVLIFSATFIRNMFHSKKNSAGHYRICISVFT
jgi:hypothetical protein